MGVPEGLTTTEARNPLTVELDQMTVAELLQVMNSEDRLVPDAIARAIPEIARAVDLVVKALHKGGRLVYLGAGTSGRLGVLDAAECPPTFGTNPELVVGLLAGGHKAMFHAVEGAEDSGDRAVADLQRIGFAPVDVLVGIAASGRTPYVIAGLAHARALGAATVSISCNPGAPVSREAQVAIELDNGPEVLTGSTRLKAGTSQKLVLNMISTAAMVRLGKVYGNLMVDVQPSNEKLVDRAIRIVAEATGCTEDEAQQALAASDGHAKTAIVMILREVGAVEARERLARADGFVRQAISDN
jgi:N-acetylmuramic acid 6-phosphate etherase